MRWIVVDGIDGSGKSTVASWARDHYSAKGESVLVRVHPSGSWAGRKSRKALEGQGKAMSILATAFFIIDVLGSVRALRKDARRYQNVIFVRYLMATAYLPSRLAPLGYDFFAKLLPVPERLILVDVAPDTAHRRITERQHTKEMFDDPSSLERTRSKVVMLAKRAGWRIIDNNGLEDETRKALVRSLEEWDSKGA